MTQRRSVRPNAKQVEEWNSATGQRWLERHERIDRQIAPFGRRAMDRAAIQRGPQGLGKIKGVPGWANRLVGLLCVLHLGLIEARGVGQF